MDNRKIGVFDSGLGGLTTVKELRALLKNEDIVYFGDTGRVPYGTKSRDTIIKYTKQDIEFIKGHDVKMIIVACGTASSIITPDMIKMADCEFTGVILPTAQAACAATTNGKIGIIGTPATVKSRVYGKAIRAIRSDAKVYGKACPMFVPLVENGYIDENCEVTKIIAAEYLKPMLSEGIDTLILGCTHYPLIYNIINEVLEYKVTLIDAGRETAKYAASLLTQKGLLSDKTTEGSCKFYVSDSVDNFSEIATRFLGENIKAQVSQIDIEGIKGE